MGLHTHHPQTTHLDFWLRLRGRQILKSSLAMDYTAQSLGPYFALWCAKTASAPLAVACVMYSIQHPSLSLVRLPHCHIVVQNERKKNQPKKAESSSTHATPHINQALAVKNVCSDMRRVPVCRHRDKLPPFSQHSALVCVYTKNASNHFYTHIYIVL